MPKSAAFIQLQDTEIMHNMYDAAITVITLFKGEPPSRFLCERAQRIVAMNPWLASRLCRDGETRRPYLRLPEHVSLSPFYERISVGDICSTGKTVDSILMESHDQRLSPALSQIFTKQGFKSENTDTPLFKIRLCTGDDGRFAIVASISHILGDGSTLYQIYGMLNPASKVIALIPERVRGLREKLAEPGVIPGSFRLLRTADPTTDDRLNWMLEAKAIWSTKESRALVGLRRGEEGDDPSRSATFSGGLFKVSPKWIREQKKAYAGDKEVPWISTNDALTSWYMTKSGAGAGIMAINARNRIRELETRHAGNYQLGFIFYPDEFTTPCLIRKAVNSFSPGMHADCHAGRGNEVAVISNWTQFYGDLDYGPSCHQLLHLPVVPPELNSPTMADSTMIVFCAGNGQLAVAVNATNLGNYLDKTALGGSLLG